MMAAAATAVILLTTGLASAKLINDIFGGGLLDVQWGMTLDQVKSVHPGGKSNNLLGRTQYYITDGRTLFGIERDKDAFINFIFSADGKLSEISIKMPDGWGDLPRIKASITSSIGVEPASVMNSDNMPVTRWDDGSGIRIDLMEAPGMFTRNVIMFIEKLPAPTDATKESLGF